MRGKGGQSGNRANHWDGVAVLRSGSSQMTVPITVISGVAVVQEQNQLRDVPFYI